MKKKKNYNPFKMWGSYIGPTSIIATTVLFPILEIILYATNENYIKEYAIKDLTCATLFYNCVKEGILYGLDPEVIEPTREAVPFVR